MPTYAFTTAKDLTSEERARLVESVTLIHNVEATAPRYFVQVVFYKVDFESIFIGGKAAPPDHVWVRADIRAGRTDQQKARILRRIMQEASSILGISEESVWVYISDIPPQATLEFGHVMPEVGGEKQWLAALPNDLRERLLQSA